MHELGILRLIIKKLEQVADSNRIKNIKCITLEVGKESGIVPYYMEKLFPVAADALPLLADAKLKICMVCGRGLVIKDIGY